MRYRLHILTIVLCLMCAAAAARPAKTGLICLRQPDGSTFGAYFRGDEFMRIKTTADGHAIMQDGDGWWCYAEYDTDGGMTCTGHRVGDRTPAAVLSGSLRIPYAKLAERARTLRRVTNMEEAARNADGTGSRMLHTRQGEEEDGGHKHGLVILAQYQDIKFKYERKDFIDMLTKEGYDLNGATGSAKEYFEGQFGGKVDFTFTVSEIVTLSKMRSYYGGNDKDGNDKNAAEMIAEACRLADPEIDFSIFDDDGDGTVDNVFVFFAGGDEAEGAGDDCIWSHAWYIHSGAHIKLSLDGKNIDRYACTSELSYTYDTSMKQTLAGIGTFCHEYSHTFGLPDLYDTDYDKEGGWAAGLWGRTSLMDGGNQNNNSNTPPYFNAIEREILGIGESLRIEEDGIYTLEPLSTGGKYLRLDTDTPGEYYLFECRDNTGWDAYTGGSGMLVYHIDKTKDNIGKWLYENTVNADSSHQCADLVEADGRTDSFEDQYQYAGLMRNLKGIFFPYNDVTSLTCESSPGLKLWNGAQHAIAVTDIRRDGDRIRFSITGFSEETTPPVPVNFSTEAYADAAAITFESSWPFNGEAAVTWGRSTQSENTVMLAPYQPGKYALVLENLEPGNKTYTVSVHFVNGEIQGEAKQISFMTAKRPPVKWPYMYFGKSAEAGKPFKEGARIALRLYNTAEAQEIRWTFNGRDIRPEPDGRFTVTTGGILKAYVTWKDGSMDIIEKRILTEKAE